MMTAISNKNVIKVKRDKKTARKSHIKIGRHNASVFVSFILYST